MTPAQIRALFEARQNAATELRSLYDNAADRELTADETATEVRLNAALDDYQTRIDGGLAQLEADARADETRSRLEAIEARSADKAGSDDVETGDLAKLRKLVAGEARSMDFEWEERDLVKGTASAGGNTVPTTLFGQLYVPMREFATVMADGGARILTTGSGEDMPFPVVSSFPAAALIAEGGTIGESDAAFGQVVLKAYKFGHMTQVSSELEQDSIVNLQAFLADVGGQALGRGMGAYFVTGTGSSQPKGITTTTNANNKTAASATAITADELMDVQHGIPSPYRPYAAWIMKDSTVKAVRKLKDSQGRYLWEASLQAGAPDTLLGSPVKPDDNMAAIATGAVTVVYGDFSHGYLVRIVGGVRIERSVDYAFNTDLVSYRFLVRADGNIIDNTAICKLTQA